MIRFKEKVKEYRLTVKVQVVFGSPLSEKELEFFSRRDMKGFLKLQSSKRYSAEFTGPAGISLYQRLQRPISKYDFFVLVGQVVAATQRLRKNALPWDRVVWDIHRAYINENTKEVQLLFLPLEGEGLPRNIIGFFETLVYAAKPAEGEGDYLAKFIYFLRCLPHYDSDRVETYISRESSGAMKAVKGQTTGGSGFITDKQREYYDHYGRQGTDEDTLLLREEEGTGLMQEDSGDATGLLQEEEGTGLLREDEEGTGLLQEDEEDTGLLREEEEGTGLLQEDEEGTGLLNEENGTGRLESVHHYPTLYRVRTEEYIEVNKPVFRLGKERSYVDYFVTNNNAVSRGHADIITRGERFFVRDLNSKNRTFINGQEIPPQCECELLDGSRLTLGNEEFIFNT